MFNRHFTNNKNEVTMKIFSQVIRSGLILALPVNVWARWKTPMRDVSNQKYQFSSSKIRGTVHPIFCRVFFLLLFCSLFSFGHSEWKQSITRDSLPYNASLCDIVYGKDQFFIGGYSFISKFSSPYSSHITDYPNPLILSSSDAQSWKIESLENSTGTLHQQADSLGIVLQILSLYYANNLLFAVDDYLYFCLIDGNSWEEKRFAKTVQGLSFKDSLYVAAGQGIQTSSDGKTWTLEDNSRRYLSIVSGSDKFVVVDNSGNVQISYNGKTWGEAVSVLNVRPIRIVFGNNQFVIIGDSGTVAVSKDAQTWKTTRLPSEQWGWNDIVYGNGKFIAVGSNSLILTSSDAVTWTSERVDPAIHFKSIAYGNNTFATIASNSSVWYLDENNANISNKLCPIKNIYCSAKVIISKTNISIQLSDISLHSTAKITLITYSGKKLNDYFVTPVNNTYTIPANNLSSGKYYIAIDLGMGKKVLCSYIKTS
jgi:hypothetical protein